MGTKQAELNKSEQTPKRIRIIPCTSLSFQEKDLIEIETWKDFIWILGKHNIIFKLKNTYYIPTSEVVYIHTPKTK